MKRTVNLFLFLAPSCKDTGCLSGTTWCKGKRKTDREGGHRPDFDAWNCFWLVTPPTCVALCSCSDASGTTHGKKEEKTNRRRSVSERAIKRAKSKGAYQAAADLLPTVPNKWAESEIVKALMRNFIELLVLSTKILPDSRSPWMSGRKRAGSIVRAWWFWGCCCPFRSWSCFDSRPEKLWDSQIGPS